MSLGRVWSVPSRGPDPRAQLPQPQVPRACCWARRGPCPPPGLPVRTPSPSGGALTGTLGNSLPSRPASVRPIRMTRTSARPVAGEDLPGLCWERLLHFKGSSERLWLCACRALPSSARTEFRCQALEGTFRVVCLPPRPPPRSHCFQLLPVPGPLVTTGRINVARETTGACGAGHSSRAKARAQVARKRAGFRFCLLQTLQNSVTVGTQPWAFPALEQVLIRARLSCMSACRLLSGAPVRGAGQMKSDHEGRGQLRG